VQRLAAEPSRFWSSASDAICVLPFKTKIKHRVSSSPPRHCLFELKITFCVRGVIRPWHTILVYHEAFR
jgi:hypothetical protein